MKRIFPALALVLLALILAGCAQKVAAKKVVSVSYTLTVDGKLYAQSTDGQPLEFMVGAGRMIPAFETALMGLKVGEKKSFVVKAADAYGEYDKTKTVDVPLSEFPAGNQPKVGDTFTVPTAQGNMPVSVAAVNGKSVTLDLNNPLAGKDLDFAIQVVKIRDATRDELLELQNQAQQAVPQ